jgi:hypothetical protein
MNLEKVLLTRPESAPSIAAEGGTALMFRVRAGRRARASRHRDMPSGEPDFGEKHREPAKPAQTRGRRFFASFLVATRKDVVLGHENPIQIRGRSPLDKKC